MPLAALGQPLPPGYGQPTINGTAGAGMGPVNGNYAGSGVDNMTIGGGFGVPQASTLLGRLQIPSDGTYSQNEQDRIAALIDNGTVTIEEAAQHYGIPLAEAQAAYAARGVPSATQGARGTPATYGLSGATNALNTGANSSLGILGNTLGTIDNRYNQGANSLYTGLQGSLGILSGALSDINTSYSAGQNALTSASTGVGNTIGSGISALQTAETNALGRIDATQGALGGMFDKGYASTEQLTPFVNQGVQAGGLQSAFSGARGAAAQQQAYDDFRESPGQAFLREQGERALLRNSAATGGLGGGNVKRELVNYGQGLALQDLTRQTGQLGEIANRGLSAGATSAGITSQLSGQQAGLNSQLAQTGANITSQLGAQQGQLSGQQASLQGQLAGQQGQLYGQQAGVTSGLGQFGANMMNNYGTGLSALRQNQAGLESGIGQVAASIPLGVGSRLADYRQQAGRDIQGIIGGTSTSLANLSSQQGSGMADLTGAQAQQVQGLIALATSGDINARIEVGRMLANLATQSASNASGMPIIPGATTNYARDYANIASAAGGVYDAINSGQSNGGGAPVYDSQPDWVR
jgi:hypothetical protein